MNSDIARLCAAWVTVVALVSAAAASPPFVGAIENTYALSGDRPLRMPSDVAALPGRVIVADGMHDRLLIFETNGNPIVEWTAIDGIGLRHPAGLCADGEDRIWIADAGNDRLEAEQDDGEDEPVPGPEARKKI